MCGLSGVFAGQLPDLDHLRRMNDALRHRGPDDGDLWVDSDAGIALGHRRLAILDLSPAGHQPMQSQSGRFVIAFNGEIYNHLDLRSELDDPGRAWRGHSDTETLLAGFEAWGVRHTLERTVGMFAIALWDKAERNLYLARDRMGEKPLYFGWTRKAFVFASELKALTRFPGFDNAVDKNVVALFMQYGSVPAPYSIYSRIFKLEPGCLLTVNSEGAAAPMGEATFAPFRRGGLSVEKYWSLPDVVERARTELLSSERDAVDALEAALSRSIGLQSIADVPLGAFLSGGIDSSTVVALMQAQARGPVRTFTIGFREDGFDEAAHARAIARHLGTEHTELYVSAEQARDVIPQLPTLYCEPFADASQIPTHLVARMARGSVTVALSGDGGDELFGGYNRYTWARRIWNRVGWLPFPLRQLMGAMVLRTPAGLIARLGRAVPGLAGIPEFGQKAHKMAHRLRLVHGVEDLYRSLVTEWDRSMSIVPGAQPLATTLDRLGTSAVWEEPETRMMLLDSLTYLPDDILHKVDRAAMSVSLETRAPFLDHRVVELAWRIPVACKIRGSVGKWVLREVLRRHVPPTLFERPKAGFGLPIGQWLRGPLREWAADLLDAHHRESGEFLNSALIRTVWAQHLAGTHDWSGRLWNVLMYEAWAREGAR